MDGLNPDKFIFSQFWGIEVGDQCFQSGFLPGPFLVVCNQLSSLCLQVIPSGCIPISSSYKDTSNIRLGPVLMTLTDYICNCHFLPRGHSETPGLGLQHGRFWGYSSTHSVWILLLIKSLDSSYMWRMGK